MDKKAFTIVELAIVLVVIGIILGMAVKGKALVHAARVKAEVAKLNKFEAAISTYYAKQGDIDHMYIPTGWTNYSIFDHRILLELGLITEADRLIDLTPIPLSGTEILKWSFFRCSEITSDPLFQNNDRNNICVATVYTSSVTGPYATDGMPVSTTSHWIAELVCNVEVVKDDENATAGHGRFTERSDAPIAYYTEDIYNNCSALPSDLVHDFYYYRVF